MRWARLIVSSSLMVVLPGAGYAADRLQAQPAAQNQNAGATHEGQAAPSTTPGTAANQLHVYAFPNKGQSAAQQSQDETYCLGWAQQQSSSAQTQANQQAPPAEAPKGEGAKGAVRGAAGGAAIGAIAGDAGAGAGAGAVVGTMAGRRRQRNAQKEAEQQQQQAQGAQQAHAQDALTRAYGACMESKGYTVK